MSGKNGPNVFGDDRVAGAVGGFGKLVTALSRSGIMLYGIIAVLVIDVLIGSKGANAWILYGTEIGSYRITPYDISFTFSAGTSAVQLMAWQSILRTPGHHWLAKVVVGVTILLDTLVDSGALVSLHTGKVAQNLLPSHPTPLGLCVWGIGIMFALCDSFFMVFMLQTLNNQGTKPTFRGALGGMRSAWGGKGGNAGAGDTTAVDDIFGDGGTT